MKSTAGIQNAASQKELEYKEQFLAQFNQYLATQHPIVCGLHLVLKGLAMICFALPFIFGVIALYYTFQYNAMTPKMKGKAKQIMASPFNTR